MESFVFDENLYTMLIICCFVDNYFITSSLLSCLMIYAGQKQFYVILVWLRRGNKCLASSSIHTCAAIAEI